MYNKAILATHLVWREENSATLIVDAWRNGLTRSKAAAVLGNSVANMPSPIRTHDLLAAFLIRCKTEGEGLDSYRPYVESLPESYSVPFFCSEREAASLPRYQSKYIYARWALTVHFG